MFSVRDVEQVESERLCSVGKNPLKNTGILSARLAAADRSTGGKDAAVIFKQGSCQRGLRLKESRFQICRWKLFPNRQGGGSVTRIPKLVFKPWQ